jgi:FMN phosphatase YigB (HAD superfamily)
MSLKVIFIDWDGTLSRSRFWQHWLDEDPESYNKIQQVLFAGNAKIVQDWMRGSVSSEQVVNEVARRSGLDYHYLMSALIKSCKSMTLAHPKVLDSIKAKRDKKVKVIIATDNMDTFNRWTVPALNLEEHFDGILNSINMGALKEEFDEDGTNPFFRLYLNQNSLRPDQFLLIDDRDMSQTAKRLGIGFIQVTPSFSVVNALQII